MYHPWVSWHIILLKVSNWNICFGQKEPINVQFFRFSSALMKVHTIPLVPFLKPQNQGLLKFCITVQYHEKWLPCIFFYLKSHTLWTKIVHWSGIFRLLSGWVKNQQISHVVLETTSHFFFKLFHHSLISWEITLLYLSSQNFIWFLQKKSINVQNFRLSSAQLKFHQVGTLIGSFCWKYIKISAKKVQENTKCDAKFKKKTICCFKCDKNLASFDPSTQKSQKLALWLVDLKACRGFIFYDAKELCKIWRKTDLWFGRWHEEFWSEHLKVSKYFHGTLLS